MEVVRGVARRGGGRGHGKDYGRECQQPAQLLHGASHSGLLSVRIARCDSWPASSAEAVNARLHAVASAQIGLLGGGNVAHGSG
jgi:hypothetical protein